MLTLFSAIKIPSSLSLQLSLLGGGLSGAKWIDRENFHITIKYFGNVDRHISQDLFYALDNGHKNSFELEITNLDIFGSIKPRALYAAVKSSEALSELHHHHERLAHNFGLKADKRKFLPHITLARLKDTSPDSAAAFLAQNGGFTSMPFKVEGFELLSSNPSRGGGPYISEAHYQLTETMLDYENYSQSAKA